MSDDEAFTTAVRENPRDDLIRLVYADWLDERGDPRGEWLRIQVQLKRHVADGRSYWPLSGRQRHLEMEAEIDPAWVAVMQRPPWQGTEIRDWQEFYDSLAVEPEGWESAVPKPTLAQLDRFETETGFRLPQSYREYIVVFGPGKLLLDWRIAAPRYGASWFYDLQGMHETLRPGRIGRDTEPHRGRVERCRYFCLKYKDRFGWDPDEVTDPAGHEYAVYRIIEDGRVVRVADTFRGFVEDALLEMLTYPNWDEAELGSPLKFESATRASV